MHNAIVFKYSSGETINVLNIQENLIIKKGQVYSYTYNQEFQRRQTLTVDASCMADYYNVLLEKDELNNAQTKSYKLPPLFDEVKLSNITLIDSKLNREDH